MACGAMLHVLGACKEAECAMGELSAESAWRVCSRGDWMFWCIARVGVEAYYVENILITCSESFALFTVREVNDAMDKLYTKPPGLELATTMYSCAEAIVREARLQHDAYGEEFDAEVLALMADMVREEVPWEEVERALCRLQV